MRETRLSGSVEWAMRNRDPYSHFDFWVVGLGFPNRFVCRNSAFIYTSNERR